MGSATVLALALCLCFAAAYGQKCGQKPATASAPWRIVGGENSVKGEWPWQISLRLRTWLGAQHICGGSLLNDQWVLTAAHCVDSYSSPSSYIVRLGEHNTKVNDGTEVDVSVSQIIKHPQWDNKAITNDVALIKLSRKLNLAGTESHLSPICLAEKNMDVDGRLCTATGWGHTRYQGTSPNILQKVNVPVLEHGTCVSAYKEIHPVTNGMICAGYDAGGKSVCQGDSGGPLQCQMEDGSWYQFGVTSWGVGCAEPGYPGVYARVTTFRDWIVQNSS